MPPPLFRDGQLLFSTGDRIAGFCLALDGAVRIIWPNRPVIQEIEAALSIPSSYYYFEQHHAEQWWWFIDFQQIYEDGLFDENGEYSFTLTCTGMVSGQSSGVYFSFTNGEDTATPSLIPAASASVTVRLDGTMTVT